MIASISPMNVNLRNRNFADSRKIQTIEPQVLWKILGSPNNKNVLFEFFYAILMQLGIDLQQKTMKAPAIDAKRLGKGFVKQNLVGRSKAQKQQKIDTQNRNKICFNNITKQNLPEFINNLVKHSTSLSQKASLHVSSDKRASEKELVAIHKELNAILAGMEKIDARLIQFYGADISSEFGDKLTVIHEMCIVGSQKIQEYFDHQPQVSYEDTSVKTAIVAEPAILQPVQKQIAEGSALETQAVGAAEEVEVLEASQKQIAQGSALEAQAFGAAEQVEVLEASQKQIIEGHTLNNPALEVIEPEQEAFKGFDSFIHSSLINLDEKKQIIDHELPQEDWIAKFQQYERKLEAIKKLKNTIIERAPGQFSNELATLKDLKVKLKESFGDVMSWQQLQEYDAIFQQVYNSVKESLIQPDQELEEILNSELSDRISQKIAFEPEYEQSLQNFALDIANVKNWISENGAEGYVEELQDIDYIESLIEQAHEMPMDSDHLQDLDQMIQQVFNKIDEKIALQQELALQENQEVTEDFYFDEVAQQQNTNYAPQLDYTFNESYLAYEVNRLKEWIKNHQDTTFYSEIFKKEYEELNLLESFLLEGKGPFTFPQLINNFEELVRKVTTDISHVPVRLKYEDMKQEFFENVSMNELSARNGMEMAERQLHFLDAKADQLRSMLGLQDSLAMFNTQIVNQQLSEVLQAKRLQSEKYSQELMHHEYFSYMKILEADVSNLKNFLGQQTDNPVAFGWMKELEQIELDLARLAKSPIRREYLETLEKFVKDIKGEMEGYFQE